MKLFSASLSSFLLLSCGGTTNKPHTEEATPAAVPRAETTKAEPDAKPQVLVGWYCPELAAGRPGVWPLFARDPTWNSNSEDLANQIASRAVKRFTVLGWHGDMVGSMSVLGAARDGKSTMAVGAYVGASVCQPKSTIAQRPPDDPVCQALTQGCGLAAGAITRSGGYGSIPYEEDPERLVLSGGQALVGAQACEGANDTLALDTDGDGSFEHFSISDLRMEGPAPVELPLANAVERCQPDFAAGVPSHPDLVRVGVMDVDGDGRFEVVYRRNNSEFLLYGAPNSPARLELLGRQQLTGTPE